MMSANRLDGLAQATLGPVLVWEHGFTFGRGMYFRDRPLGLCELFAIDLMTGREAFRVMLGFTYLKMFECEDAPAPHGPESSFLVVRYLNGNGVGDTYRRWPCRTKELATRSLSQIAGFVPTVALAWFAQVRGPDDLIDRLDRLVLGRFLEAAGARSRAHAAYLEDEQRLQAQLLQARAATKSREREVQIKVLVEELLPAVHRAVERTADRG